MKFHSKALNLYMVLDLIHVYQYIHHKKIHPKISLTTLVLKYLCNVCYQKQFAKRLYLWLQSLEGLLCLRPFPKAKFFPLKGFMAEIGAHKNKASNLLKLKCKINNKLVCYFKFKGNKFVHDFANE
jgi:hypothetical protein